MSDFRARLGQAIIAGDVSNPFVVEGLLKSIMAFLANPTDADVERVARAYDREGWTWFDDGKDTTLPQVKQDLLGWKEARLRRIRAAIHALVGEAGG